MTECNRQGDRACHASTQLALALTRLYVLALAERAAIRYWGRALATREAKREQKQFLSWYPSAWYTTPMDECVCPCATSMQRTNLPRSAAANSIRLQLVRPHGHSCPCARVSIGGSLLPVPLNVIAHRTP